MTRHGYIALETVISAVINTVMTAVFAFLVFGGAAVDLGARATLFDMVPQGFMVAFMGTLIPCLLTRRRIAAGKIEGVTRAQRPFVRAVMTGIAVALAGTAAYWLLVPAAVVTFTTFLAAKAGYAIAVTVLVTPTALVAALGPARASARM